MLRKGLKLLAYVVGALVLLVATVAIYFSARWPRTYPDAPRPDLKASDDPAIIARGEYLFHTIGHCTGCHDPDIRDRPRGTKGAPKGGYEWKMGPLGTLRSANITSDPETGIGTWSDADIARVIKYAVRPDDRAAFMMFAVGPMADDDIVALMSYVRTIEPVSNAVADHEVSVMGKVIFSTAMGFLFSRKPEFPAPPYVPEGDVSVARGKYIAEGPGLCFGCHSPWNGEGFDGPLFSGNPTPWPDPNAPGYEIYAPNLTPHAEHGSLVGLSEDQFLERMRAPRVYASPMAWENFGEMTDADLRSIYRYLASLEPAEGEFRPIHRKKA